MSSSLWPQLSQTASHSADSAWGHPSNLADIVAAAGSELPLLAPFDLSFDTTLGKGSSFIVNRELYSGVRRPFYVAVKYIITADQPPRRLQQHYDRVVRELRVLTHPNLKVNQYILTILAYGWSNGPEGERPYIVVDYSNMGTLNEYLPRFEHPEDNLREYALDVALGLKALHENKIIHGDIKPSNILMFTAVGTERNEVAKISDFGGAIFDADDKTLVTYGGTSIYNAPEQEGRGKYKSEEMFKMEQLYQADIYSFGITLWEIMKRGKSYIDYEWLARDELRAEFLDRIHDEEEDPLLRRAEVFCNTLVSSFSEKIRDCFRMTLRDQASQRSDMAQIVGKLAYRNLTSRPVATASTGVWSPPSQSSSSPVRSQSLDGVPRSSLSVRLGTRWNNRLVRYVDDNDSKLEVHVYDGTFKDARKGIMTRILKPNVPDIPISTFENTNLFQATLSSCPPWSVQYEVCRNWHQEAGSKNATEYSQANLQLAICWHIGYGVKPDRDDMLRHLTNSLKASGTARILYHRLTSAITLGIENPWVDTHTTNLDRQLMPYTDQENYFSVRVHLYQQIQIKERQSAKHSAEQEQHRAMLLAELVTRRELSLLSDALGSNEYDNSDMSYALLEASRSGDASMVLLICAHCEKFVQDESLPTPLHLLIMFEELEVKAVAEALVCGLSADQVGPCKANLNSVPRADPEAFFMPEHCLDLFGTPLHWAVRTRNLKLVELLIQLGADINARTENPTASITSIDKPRLPALSPLDIAVMYHLPEIVARLLDLGANREGGGGLYVASHSALLCIGLPCVPFSRYIIHGMQYRDALKTTIRVLIDRGYNINDTKYSGYDPINIALSNRDCEPYIIEELLGAGAVPSQRSLETEEGAVDIAIGHAPFRRYSVENLRLVLPYVHDVNECSLGQYNPLHLAAAGGSEAMVEVISNAKGFDVDTTTPVKKNSRHGKKTALHLAAMLGFVEVVLMLVQHGANIEALDAQSFTPLQQAIFYRNTEVADALIKLGANVFFNFGTPYADTILHIATANSFSDCTLVKHLLTKHSRLRDPSILNAVDRNGQTVLYNAARWGDYEAVDVLLASGADRRLTWQYSDVLPGITPLQGVEQALERHSKGNWDFGSFKRMAKDLQAKNCHAANLQEILRMLKHDYLS